MADLSVRDNGAVRFLGSEWKSLKANLDHGTQHEDIPNGALCLLLNDPGAMIKACP